VRRSCCGPGPGRRYALSRRGVAPRLAGLADDAVPRLGARHAHHGGFPRSPGRSGMDRGARRGRCAVTSRAPSWPARRRTNRNRRGDHGLQFVPHARADCLSLPRSVVQDALLTGADGQPLAASAHHRAGRRPYLLTNCRLSTRGLSGFQLDPAIECSTSWQLSYGGQVGNVSNEASALCAAEGALENEFLRATLTRRVSWCRCGTRSRAASAA